MSHDKKLPKVHVNYYYQIKNYKEMNINYKILTDNMFQNYFLVSYQCHKYFFLLMYIYTKKQFEYFFDETIQVYFLTRKKGPNSKNETPSFYNWAIYQTALKKLNWFSLLSTKVLRKIWLLIKLGCKMMLLCDWRLDINLVIDKVNTRKNEKLIIVVHFWCTQN